LFVEYSGFKRFVNVDINDILLFETFSEVQNFSFFLFLFLLLLEFVSSIVAIWTLSQCWNVVIDDITLIELVPLISKGVIFIEILMLWS
jgi:hypothetical protein